MRDAGYAILTSRSGVNLCGNEQERLEDQDAETRVNAVRGLTAVCETLFGGPPETLPSSTTCTDAPVPLKSLIPVLRGQVMHILFKSLEDYAIDNRGDVGSWVREGCHGWLEKVYISSLLK